KAKRADWAKAANAIRTTDTFAKGASATCEIDGTPVTICGIAKGSGMIEPALGTMLSFIWTDAAIPAPVLDKLIGPLVDESYNAISVDSDTSTSDTVLVFATGAAKTAKVERAGDPKLKAFKAALGLVMKDLALQVVRDGEGAQKLISVKVSGAKSKRSAMKIAKAIANSPLVKTAVAGEDPNWGRIVMAVGKAGEPANRDKLAIDIGDTKVARKGLVVPGYDEMPVAQYMKGDRIAFTVDVGVGKAEATAYTCDLTHGYISINADYRS
ncbi:MAG: bifunctional glutamate N-acetyltransferase/amino-acid acetyltransferase ArgJ, partial [Alphaproteobacteria bacterium]